MESDFPSVRWSYILIIIVLFAAGLVRGAPSPTPALPPAPPQPQPGEELTVSVITFEQGDAVFEKFGHNAILIQDASAARGEQDIVFHWGVFDFRAEGFFIKYARGEMDYAMGAFLLGDQLEGYAAANRSMWRQELNLTPPQRLKLRAYLYWHLRPENATYRYNYYTDNCSTRVRDAIDLALDGAIKRQLQPRATAHTFRWHTRRLTRQSPFWYTVLHTVLGPAVDRRIDEWDEGFLPLALRDHLRGVTTVAANGAAEPLVKSEQMLFESDRAPEAQEPPSWIVQFFLAGAVVAAVLVGLCLWAMRRRTRGSRFAFGLAATGTALLLGACGMIGLWFWLFSIHWAAWRNENLFGYSPLALPLALLWPVLLRKPDRLKGLALGLAVALAGTTIVGVLLAPVLPQVNGEPLAFVLPVNLAMAFAAWKVTRGGSAARRAAFDAPAASGR